MQGFLSYLQRITITDEKRGNRHDLKSGTFPRTGRWFCAVSVGSQFCWDTASTQSVVAWINDLHLTKLELSVYMLDHYWEHKVFSGWSSVLWWTLIVRATLSTHGHWLTFIFISYDSYLLAPKRSRILVVLIVGMQLRTVNTFKPNILIGQKWTSVTNLSS